MRIWQSVKANPGTSREGQAGTVRAIDPSKPDEVGVRWDLDGVIEATAVADLTPLD